jgi:hypothetical protein
MNTAIPVIEEELKPGSKRLYFFFGGLHGQLGLGTFEFMQSARVLDDSRIFLRDPHQAWYQRGIPTIGDNVHEVARFLQRKIEDSGAEEVRFVGNCMGGFAAILFCALTQQGRAIAFVPQSFISPEKVALNRDERVPDKFADMHRHRNEHHIYDLQQWLPLHAPDVSADIYVSTSEHIDIVHARELENLPNIRIRYFEEGGHRLVMHLRDRGLLYEILSE